MKVKYTNFPQAMHTAPAFAQIGLTEQVAMSLYKDDLSRLKITQYDFKDIDSAQIINRQIGFIKLIMYKVPKIILMRSIFVFVVMLLMQIDVLLIINVYLFYEYVILIMGECGRTNSS